MNYAILRVQKLKTNTAVRGSLRHAFRAQNTPNADPSREHENTHTGADSVDEAMKAFKARLPDKVRKNGVRCVEYLMTASPEKMNELSRDKQDAYFEDALKWLKEKHGSENVVYSGIHRDETTPHMYAYVVPIDEKGKLNCRKFLGGTKHVMSELQDDFAQKVGKEHGMDRGIKGSKAKHQTIQKYYATIQKSGEAAYLAKKPRMLKKGIFVNKLEKKDDIIDRLAEETAALKSDQENENRRARSDQRTIDNLDARLKSMEPVLDLQKADRELVLEKARELKIARDKANKKSREQRNSDRGTSR